MLARPTHLECTRYSGEFRAYVDFALCGAIRGAHMTKDPDRVTCRKCKAKMDENARISIGVPLLDFINVA